MKTIKRASFSGNVKYYGTDIDVLIPENYVEKDEELRAVWVSTVANIDIPRIETEEQFKGYLISILEKVKEYHMNTVVFQVRPMSDALYKSEMNPWSSVLTGVQGKDPGFDVFGYFVEEAKKRNITVHAWINPYRIRNTTDIKNISIENPCYKWLGTDNVKIIKGTFNIMNSYY